MPIAGRRESKQSPSVSSQQPATVHPPKLGDGALALLDVKLGLAFELGGKVRNELLIKLSATDRRLVKMAKHL